MYFTKYLLKENLEKYIKMVKYKIPLQAVKNKMISEGFDPDSIDVIYK